MPDHTRTPRSLLVDRFFTQCLVEEKKEEQEQEKEKEQEQEQEQEQEKEQEEKKKKKKSEKEREERKREGKRKGKRRERKVREREREREPSLTTHHTHAPPQDTPHWWITDPEVDSRLSGMHTLFHCPLYLVVTCSSFLHVEYSLLPFREMTLGMVSVFSAELG